jgi:trk system potassium uptake protein
MNVVILGAGTIGASIAELLCVHKHNVTLVDSSRSALAQVEESLDIQTVHGSCCDAVTLFQAGVQSAILCLAVTNLDEVNLIGASMAKAMGAKRTMARVFNPTYRDLSTFDYPSHFGISRLLSLEHLTALEIARGIRMRGLHSIESFMRGEVEVQEVTVTQGSRVIGESVSELQFPKEVRIGTILRDHRTFLPSAADRIQEGDQLTLIGTHEKIEQLRKLFAHRALPKQNVIIAGGGEIGFNLASFLQEQHAHVTLMEADPGRCAYLAERLEHTTVLHADITRRSEMEEARVGKADIFVAATGHDEDNIVCGVEAKALGCRKILAVIRRPDYANVLEKLGIDLAVSPREVMARQVLAMVQSGPVLLRTELGESDTEILEIRVRKDSPISRGPLKSLGLTNCLIAAFERSQYVRIPGADDQLSPGDVAVVLTQRGETAEQVINLFESPR